MFVHQTDPSTHYESIFPTNLFLFWCIDFLDILLIKIRFSRSANPFLASFSRYFGWMLLQIQFGYFLELKSSSQQRQNGLLEGPEVAVCSANSVRCGDYHGSLVSTFDVRCIKIRKGSTAPHLAQLNGAPDPLLTMSCTRRWSDQSYFARIDQGQGRVIDRQVLPRPVCMCESEQ
jgi:hypothetical protein